MYDYRKNLRKCEKYRRYDMIIEKKIGNGKNAEGMI